MHHLFDVPPAVYRLLIAYLALDRAFCNAFVPVFRAPLKDGIRVLTSVGPYLKDVAKEQASGS